MFSPERHLQLARFLDIRPDSRVIDLGCGPGHTLVEIAGQLGPSGSLVGADRSEQPLPAALMGDDRVSLVVGDVAEQFLFAADTFDRGVCFNVLEEIADPGSFLIEVWRILVPGGLLVLGHSDFDTMVFTSDDLALTRRLVHSFCDTTHSWMQRSDGTMGRKLAGIVAASPFRAEQVVGWVNLLTSFEPGAPGRDAAEVVANSARNDPAIEDGAIESWLAGLSSLAQHDGFLYSVNDYAVVARKAWQ